MADTEVSWEDFKKEAASLADRARDEGSIVLFRGQASSEWRLQTTLERSGLLEEVADYYRTALRVKPEVEAYTGLTWSDEPSIYEIERDVLAGYDTFSSVMLRGSLPHYSYLAYLRHHGFPSPLLDWSASAMVAAFFAFRGADAENVAIYAFRERDASGMKTGGSDEPVIRLLGPYVAAPKRHFAQRSYYTVCTQWQEVSPYFLEHTNVCKPFDPKADFQQDILFKFVLSNSQRREVIRELAEYNLSAYTLFGSEEGLMESLAMRAEFD
ncbi:FRG domain-containing protein [Bradyrhizobium sp. 192]|uniref:FRG domain-containing protein n=1 Tax=Bradyrhizobium sp. 192 TaxID=2782660 RepID=UPI001FFF9992|nr:FRG domain-containing protein [Bradyrhizobium sp. 192]UPJ60206.1 FRG domain-containing protein [Bradyrhizobium sp. 192]